MNYDEFLTNICQGTAELIGKEEISGKKVTLQKVIKNNDVELDALIIIDKNSHISPTIYINHYYEEYTDGRDFDDIVDEIFGLYCMHSCDLHFDIDIFRDFEKIKDKIVYKIINAKSNKKLLKDVPHIKYMDLAIVFYCIFEDESNGNATILIHKSHFDMWGITLRKMYKIAAENTVRILPPEIKDIDSIVKTIISEDIRKDILSSDTVRERFENEYGSVDKVAEEIMDDISAFRHDLKMYVLTNARRFNGAICILYDNVLKNFADKMEKDLYILPSSVHEVILVLYEENICKAELDDLVKEVNREELDISDILSDHAYFFSREDGKIHM